MSFKERQGLDADVTTALGGVDKKTGRANPTRVEGYYLGYKETANKKAKTGVSKLHILQTAKGNLGVWGKTDLDRKISGVKPGTMVRLTQSGTIPTPNGDMYKFKVEVDEENTIEVDESAAPASTEAAQSYADEDDAETDPFSEETADALDEVPYTPPTKAARAAATPSAANQAKVQALLANKRQAS